MSSFLRIMLVEPVAIMSGPRRRASTSKLLVTLPVAAAAVASLIVGDQEDDYVACLIETAAKIMKTQAVKDPAKALDEAAKHCQPPPQVG
ncbi:hypothetical protein [Mesorhizobium amorphae]|uniref:hypothetical protein n=1 Tax=Mesorhizobium amorphae TaxID=71433 RepID=UPI00177D4466|nr:hypothetical protein [Mesorhizobium amorphae]